MPAHAIAIWAWLQVKASKGGAERVELRLDAAKHRRSSRTKLKQGVWDVE